MTVVAASEANIKAMIGGEKPKGDPKWGESVRRAARGHAFLALDVAWAREQWKPLLRELDPESVYGMALAPISPLQEMVRSPGRHARWGRGPVDRLREFLPATMPAPSEFDGRSTP